MPEDTTRRPKHLVRAYLLLEVSTRDDTLSQFLREFCVTQCCFVMLRGAKCNGRHASYRIDLDYLLTDGTYNAKADGSSN